LRAVCSFLLVSLLCVPAAGETPTASFAELSGARASFEQAMTAYGQGRFRAAIEHFREAWGGKKLPVTVAAVHLRTAVHALEELIGTVDVDDVLDRVFSSFCVGK